jgi:hypothetical protein
MDRYVRVSRAGGRGSEGFISPELQQQERGVGDRLNRLAEAVVGLSGAGIGDGVSEQREFE